MTLSRTLEQRAIIAQADAIKRGERQAAGKIRKAEKRERDRALVDSDAPNKRDPRQRDAGFLSWLHQDLPCIGCLIEGPGPVGFATIEAAHQKVAIAAKGWAKGGLGPRVHDVRCVPLCAWHHRLAANSCDTGGQRKFWDRLGIGDDVADFCRDLFDAYRQGQPGRPVVMAYAAAGRARLASEAAPTKKAARSALEN